MADAGARDEVTASDVLAAAARLRRYLPPTPLHHAERFGCWLKLENLQRTGAYKVRGALNALLAARERGDGAVMLQAQSTAVGFYERHGFVPEGAVFEAAGLPHQAMRRAL